VNHFDVLEHCPTPVPPSKPMAMRVYGEVAQNKPYPTLMNHWDKSGTLRMFRSTHTVKLNAGKGLRAEQGWDTLEQCSSMEVTSERIPV